MKLVNTKTLKDKTYITEHVLHLTETYSWNDQLWTDWLPK